MFSTDLPRLDWYGEQMAHEPSAENSFGLSSLAQTPARALLSHIEDGGSVVAFIMQRDRPVRRNPLEVVLSSMEARAAEHRALMAKLKGGAQ